MSYGFGIVQMIGWLIPIAELVLGVIALKISKPAGWMMITSPILSIMAYATMTVWGLWSHHSSSGPDFRQIAFILTSMFGQALFAAGAFLILLQAKALKKRAEEQQMLLDEITSRH
jgi:hypothetical protein